MILRIVLYIGFPIFGKRTLLVNCNVNLFLYDFLFLALFYIINTVPGTLLTIEETKVANSKAFVRELSHEIRTPMTVIVGGLDTIEHVLQIVKDKIPEANYVEISEALADSKACIDTSIGILNDVLEMDKMIEGHDTYEKVPTNLCKFIETAAQIFHGKAV